MVFDEWREWLPSQIGGSVSKSDPEKRLFLMSGDNQEKIRRDVANVGSQMLRVDDMGLSENVGYIPNEIAIS